MILAFIPACGECPPCLKGYRSLCDRGALLLGGKAIADGTSRVHAGSTEVSPMNLLGTVAPYMTVHKDSVVKIDPDVPFESAAILGCALPTGFGSATNVAQVQPGETVVIVGVGGIGMSALQGAVISGARNVIAIDPVDFKRDQAVKFGATHVYPSMAEAIAPIIDLTHGVMAEKTIITVGEMRGEYIEEAMTLTAKTWHVRGDRHGRDDRRRRETQPLPVHDVAEDVEGQHLRRRQLTCRHAEPGGPVQVGAAEDRRDGDQHLHVGRHQRRLSGHARRQNIRGVIKFTESDW